MTDHSLTQDLDPTPLVAMLVEKTKAGRLNWLATADEHAFIASVGREPGNDTTFKMTLERDYIPDPFGSMDVGDVPVLLLLDPKGRTLSEIHSSQVKDGLWPLYRLAQRIGNKLDERMTALMEVLQRL